MKICYLVLAGIISLSPVLAVAQNLTLPIYRLVIDPAYLDSLEANPTSQETYPAELEYEDEIFPCAVNYRGTSGLSQPKKSWNIFYDEEGPEGRSETNLNSEYRDLSLSRNYLAMSLADNCGMDVPDTRYISMFQNDVYYGVYLEIEEIDDEFFEERDLECGAMFKAVTNGARFAPPRNPQSLLWYYEPGFTEIGAADTLGARLAYIQYGHHSIFAETLNESFDVESFIKFFAVNYCIGNLDGFIKNYFIYEDSDNKYSILPWDCDATFGNNYLGIYVGGEDELTYQMLDHQAIFQRIISIDEYRSEFLAEVEDIIMNKFDDLLETKDELFYDIRNDVYQDTFKLGSDEEFDTEFFVIGDYILARSAAMTNLDWFHRIDLDSYSTTPDFISSVSDTIHFEAVPAGPAQSIQLVLTDSLNATRYQYFYDNGASGDSIAGDGIYSVDMVFDDLTPPFYYSFNVKYSAAEWYPTPPAGWILYYIYPVTRPVIRLDNDPPLADDFQFGGFYRNEILGLHYFSLINTAAASRNLSGCLVQVGSGHQMMQIWDADTVQPGDSLIITNSIDQTIPMFGAGSIAGNLYFQPEAGDTVNIKTSSGDVLSSVIAPDIQPFEEYAGPVLINEINYNSSDDFDPEDWIELYAPEEDVNLSGWQLRDSRQDHTFHFPGGFVLSQEEYLVVAKNPDSFHSLFPTVNNVIGGFDFSFSGDGEEIRLLDSNCGLIDYVAYDDNAPWPEEPDGQGPTLELINHDLPNYSHTNWSSSNEDNPHGTPGSINSTFTSDSSEPNPNLPRRWEIVSFFPNPFNDAIIIVYDCPVKGLAEFKIYNILGEEVSSFDRQINGPGRYEIAWNAASSQDRPLASGIYFVSLKNDYHGKIEKIVLLK